MGLPCVKVYVYIYYTVLDKKVNKKKQKTIIHYYYHKF